MLLKSYENQTFNEAFELYNQEIIGNIYFSGCEFNKSFSFSKIKTKGKITFEHCTFNSILIIDSLECNFFIFNGCKTSTFTLKNSEIYYFTISDLIGKGIGLSNCNITYTTIERTELDHLIINNLNSNYLIQDSKISFEQAKIKKVEINSISLNAKLSFISGEYDTINITGTYINPIVFTDLISIENLFFDSCTFKERIDFKEGNIAHLHLYRSVFFGLVVINSLSRILNKHESKVLIIKEINIHSNTFEQDFTISNILIETLNLSSNNFKQTFHFYSLIKTKNSIFLILDGTNSGNLIFENLLGHIDLKCINFGYIYFRNIEISMIIVKEFQNNGLLSFSNIKHSPLRTFLIVQDSNIGRTEFIDTDLNKFTEIVFANSIIEKSSFSTYPFKIKSFNKDKRIGFGITKKENNKNLANIHKQLKQVALANKDIDIASRYQSLEYKYLMRNKKFYQWDKILLFLNHISNSNGYNWTRGIFFTFIISVLSFGAYGLSVCMEWELKPLWENYVSFITSFPKLKLDSYNNQTTSAQISIWASRIFIGYGIYQTIAAFRKYGK